MSFRTTFSSVAIAMLLTASAAYGQTSPQDTTSAPVVITLDQAISIALDENASAFSSDEGPGCDVHQDDGLVRLRERGERIGGLGDADDEAARAAGKLVPDRLRGELVACAVDGEVPAVSGGKVFENAAQLVLSRDARHLERDDHMLRTCVHDGYYSRLIIEKMMFSC